MTVRVLRGDCRALLPTLPAGSVQCVVTSPPYFGLRSYLPEGHADKRLEIGLEASPEAFVAELVAVFREVWRVLRDDGVVWLNLGDSYASSWPCNRRNQIGNPSLASGKRADRPARMGGDLKEKDLIGIPWMVAFALRADGWYLRSATIWHKPAPMPESVVDRPTSAYENVFLLSKAEQYFYDAFAIAEVSSGRASGNIERVARSDRGGAPSHPGNQAGNIPTEGFSTRNKRNVWTIASEPFPGSHFATMPSELASECIKAGTSEFGACACCGAPFERILEKGEPDLVAQRKCGGNAFGGYHGVATKTYLEAGVQVPGDVKARILAGMRFKVTKGWRPTCDCPLPPPPPVPCVVLDPFGGAGTTGLVADRLGRDAILIDLNGDYVRMIERRITTDGPLFASLAVAS